jgi:hypothetical protein
MAVEPEEDEHISRQVVYEHTTSSRQNVGVIIAIVVLALALVVFIVILVREKPPHRRGALDVSPASQVVVANAGFPVVYV